MSKSYPFIISDESLNSQGFRILNAGLDVTNFLKNPIGLWNHNRDSWRGSTEDILPICRWENLRQENGQWKADAVFDDKDEFAIKIMNKVEQKIINATSIGVKLLEWSEDAALLILGQTRPTVIKCELMEISIVDIPSNKSCVSLYDTDGNMLELSDELIETILPILKLNNETMDFIDEVGSVLNLSDKPTKEAVLSAVKSAVASNAQLTAKEGEIATLKEQLKGFEEKALAEEKAKIEALVDQALTDKKITAEDKPMWLSLAEKDFNSAKALLDKMPAPKQFGVGEPQELGETAWDSRMKEIRGEK